MLALFTYNLSPNLALASIALLIVSLFIAKPWLIAAWGHMRMRRHMYLLHKQGAQILENIHFQDRKGKPVYIEYLILDSDITCLNSAAHSGSICGSLRDAMWCQQNKQKTFRFESPLRQHEHICKALQSLIGDRIGIQAVTLFTHATMNTPEHEDIITLEQLALRLPINKTKKSKRYIQGLTQLIQNISLTEQTQPITQHGNPARLKTAQTLLFSSVAVMFSAIFLTLYNTL